MSAGTDANARASATNAIKMSASAGFSRFQLAIAKLHRCSGIRPGRWGVSLGNMIGQPTGRSGTDEDTVHLLPPTISVTHKRPSFPMRRVSIRPCKGLPFDNANALAHAQSGGPQTSTHFIGSPKL